MDEYNRSPSPRRASSIGEVTIDMLFRQVEDYKREMRNEMKTLRGLFESDMRSVLHEDENTKGRIEQLEDVVALQGNQVLHDIYEALTGTRRPGGAADEICKFMHKLVDDKLSQIGYATPRKGSPPRRVHSQTSPPSKGTPQSLALSSSIEMCKEALARHQLNMDRFEEAVRHDQNEIVRAVRDIGMRQGQLQEAITSLQQAGALAQSPRASPARRSGTALSIEEVFPAAGHDVTSLRTYMDNELRKLSSSVEASKELFLTSTTEMQSDVVTLQAKVERANKHPGKGDLALVRQDVSALTAAVDALQTLKETAAQTPPSETQGAGSIRQRRALEARVDTLQQELKTLASAVRKSQLSDKMLKELKNEMVTVNASMKEAKAEESSKPADDYCLMKDFNKLASKTTSEVALLKDRVTVLEGLCDQFTSDLSVVKGEVQDVRCPPPSPVEDAQYETLQEELHGLRDQLQQEIAELKDSAGDVPQELLGVLRKARLDVEKLEVTVGDIKHEITSTKEDRVTYRAMVEGQIETLSAAVENLQAAQSPLGDRSHVLFSPKDVCDELKADQNDIKKEMMALADEVQELQDLPAKVDTLRSDVDTISSKLSAKLAPVSIDSVPSTSCGGFTSIASPKATSPFEEQ